MNEEIILSRKEWLASTLQRNHNLLSRSLEGMTPEASLARIGQEGNNFNWVLGHLVGQRGTILKNLGADARVPEEVANKYSRSQPLPLGEETPLAELAALLEATSAAIEAALAAASTELLARPGRRDMNVLETLEFMVWHETYHTGQAAVYRRQVGLDGIIDRK